ncbi:MAG: M1 family metallopeptidase [Thermoanaerobaculia bacterium]
MKASTLRVVFGLLVAESATVPARDATAQVKATVQVADSGYEALRAATPVEGVAVQALAVERDAIRFEFETGVFWLLPPVRGRVTGAVFEGKGHYTLTPARESEKWHLAVVTENKSLSVLTDSFDELVLLFTDGTADEIKSGGAPASASAEKAVSVWERFWKREKKELRPNLRLRLLTDLVEKTPASNGVFLAFTEGKKLPSALMAVDPRGIESLGVGSLLGDEKVLFLSFDDWHGGFWYLSPMKDAAQRGRETSLYPAEAVHYAIDTRIKKNTDLEGTATIRFKVSRPGTQLLRLHLRWKLRVRDVSFASGDEAPKPVEFIQEGGLAVALPAPMNAGDTGTLSIRYAGESVLEDAGDGNFYVSARESWYPNFNTFARPATFDLTYRVPPKFEVVSVGTLVETKAEKDAAFSRWKVDSPIRVAGFNYGRFKKLEKKDSETGFDIRVFTNPGKPSFARELEEVLELARFDTDRLADSALVDGINSARTFEMFFGPLPRKEISITQQTQWNFGQSWPSLVFLPYIAFLGSYTRQQLGLVGASSFVDEVGYHEFSHQWWGHHVGWATYHDQWLSEGFAEFSAALAVQQTHGVKDYVSFWNGARKRILGTPRGGRLPNADVGPITLGFRLSDRRDPGAYQALVYSKGGYVLHMLRMLMWDTKDKNSDTRFIAMMKDFTSTWAGKNPSTDDFQAAAERHIVPAMDLKKDGKLDWFFDQWVRGTEIPRFSNKLEIKDEGGGKYRITGEVSQSDVSPGFITLLPLYVEFDKGDLVRLGTLVMNGPVTVPANSEIRLPKKPKRLVINAYRDVLSRD